MKKCPYCAEEIQDEAILCRYCNQRLDEPKVQVWREDEDEYEEDEVKQRPSWAKFVLIGIILVVSSVMIYLILDMQGDRVVQDITNEITGQDNRNVTVVYEIQGTANSGSVTWMNAQGGIEQNENVSIPFRKTYQMHRGDLLSLLVQNSEDSGTVICQIKVDGEVVERAESNGAYVIAVCSGIVE